MIKSIIQFLVTVDSGLQFSAKHCIARRNQWVHWGGASGQKTIHTAHRRLFQTQAPSLKFDVDQRRTTITTTAAGSVIFTLGLHLDRRH